MDFDPTCKACEAIKGAETKAGFVYADDTWVLRHTGAPYAAVGWMTMHARRHVANGAFFNETEQATFGRMVHRVSNAIVAATGALRVYFASLSEGTPHFHVHFVPRYKDGPTQWKAFDDLARAREGLVTVDPNRVAEVIRAVSATLAR